MADQLARFGMAIAVVTLIVSGLYQFTGRAVEPEITGSITHFRK